MPYNSYYPATYQPIYQPPAYPPAGQQQPQTQQQTQPQTTNRWDWVQGETGAKSYLVAPNTTVLLLDSESQRFYLKSADASGMPMPLRTFSYTETTQAAAGATIATEAHTETQYATKADVEALTRRIDALTVKEAADDE